MGAYTAADAYPYLAGQSGLGALIVPGWALEGGRDAMLKRLADPATRARIVKEAEAAMTARFGGPQGVYLPRTQQELTAVMTEMNAGPGETVLRILEQGDPGAILRFGSEADLIRILADPVTSMACDCGASTATRVHPRFYGSYPRVFGRYVREQKIMTWEQAIRKSTWLPAATIGMSDRGLLAPGMAADVTILNPDTVIDHATYESPALPSDGIAWVIVNGKVALADGKATGVRAGAALYRTGNMPSRPVTDGARTLTAKGTASGRRVAITLTQRAGAREATGTVTIEGLEPMTRFGTLQVTDGWANVTGTDIATAENVSLSATRGSRAVAITVDLHDPRARGSAALAIDLDGQPWLRGTLPLAAVAITRP
jgi:hypothetical protein